MTLREILAMDGDEVTALLYSVAPRWLESSSEWAEYLALSLAYRPGDDDAELLAALRRYEVARAFAILRALRS